MSYALELAAYVLSIIVALIMARFATNEIMLTTAWMLVWMIVTQIVTMQLQQAGSGQLVLDYAPGIRLGRIAGIAVIGLVLDRRKAWKAGLSR